MEKYPRETSQVAGVVGGSGSLKDTLSQPVQRYLQQVGLTLEEALKKEDVDLDECVEIIESVPECGWWADCNRSDSYSTERDIAPKDSEAAEKRQPRKRKAITSVRKPNTRSKRFNKR